jgi:hypothetical protein
VKAPSARSTGATSSPINAFNTVDLPDRHGPTTAIRSGCSNLAT